MLMLRSLKILLKLVLFINELKHDYADQDLIKLNNKPFICISAHLQPSLFC